MRHRKSKKTLGRESAAKKALMQSLAQSLVLHGRITTTLAKAKVLRPYVEKLITKSKTSSGQSLTRYLKARVTQKASNKIMKDLSSRYQNRNGGYTRIIKLTRRQGDASEQAIIEFV